MTLKTKLLFGGFVLGTAIALNLGWGYLRNSYFKSGRVGDFNYSSGITISGWHLVRSTTLRSRDGQGVSLGEVSLYDYDKDGKVDEVQFSNVQPGSPLEQFVNLQKLNELYAKTQEEQ